MLDEPLRRKAVVEARSEERPAAAPVRDRGHRFKAPVFKSAVSERKAPVSPPFDGPGFRGVEVVVEWRGSVEALARALQHADPYGAYRLSEIVHRGVVIWPNRDTLNASVCRFGCRFRAVQPVREAERRLTDLLAEIGEHMRWICVEKLESRQARHRPLGV